MSTDAEPVPARTENSIAPQAPRRKKKKGRRARLSRPLSEREINAPDMQTLVMLGVLAAAAIGLWIFAHAGCNYHPPRETRVPRKVTTAELTHEPKDAAIEFQQRLMMLDFKGAQEIAAGPAVAQVKQQQTECESNPGNCAARRKGLKEVITSATVIERTPMSARARITSYHLPTGDKTFLALVERDAGGWKVTAHVPDAPDATLPAPVLTPPGAARFNVMPSGSGNTLQLVPSPGGATPPASAGAARPALRNPAAPAPGTATGP